MSTHLMVGVDQFAVPADMRSILLALADWAGGEDGNTVFAVSAADLRERVAWKTMLPEDEVAGRLNELVAFGVLELAGRAGDGSGCWFCIEPGGLLRKEDFAAWRARSHLSRETYLDMIESPFLNWRRSDGCAEPGMFDMEGL